MTLIWPSCGADYDRLSLGNATYSEALRNPAPAASGQSGSAAASRAVSNSKWGRELRPPATASAAAVPKISTGVASGRISSGSRTPPRRAPSSDRCAGGA